MRILALAERALDKEALLRLLYSRSLRSRSNDSEENARMVENGKNREKVKEIPKKKQNISELVNIFSLFNGVVTVRGG